jgi:hypothetical protein
MLLSSPAWVSAVELPGTAKLVPPETIVMVNIDNFSQLRAQFEKTSLYKLYKDPAMKAFVDDVKAKWQEKKQKSENELLRIIADANVWPQGRAAVALVLDERAKDANEPPVLFITQWGENIDKVKDAVSKIVEKAVEKGARREAEDYRGVNTIRITQEPSKGLSYCFIDDCLIGSMSPDVLKFVIAQVKGAGSPTLGDDGDYNATLGAIGPAAEGQINFYVNIKQIIKSALAEDTEGQAKTMINNLGLANVTSFGGSVDVGRGPGGETSGKAFLKIDGDKKGVCKILEVESAALRMPPFVSASSSSVSVFNLNIKKAYAELGAILNNFSPQMAAMLNMPLLPPGPQGEPALQLKADIVDYLGSQIVLVQSIKKPSSDAGAPGAAQEQASTAPQTLVAVAIDNRNALEKSLSTLHDKMTAPGNPDAKRQLLGHTIYSVDVSGFLPFLGASQRTPMQAPPRPDAGVPKAPPAAFTVTDTHLILGGEATVERAIRALGGSQAESIDSAKWFAKAKSNIPSAVGLAGLQDNAASGEYFWSTMRELQKKEKDKDKGSGNQIGVGVSSASLFPQMIFSQGGSDMFDFGLLPEFDAVRKYFGLSASYGISRADGFFFEFKYLNPDAAE